jgi:RsiW-degrading membrane proteinase PrsW (M82 family)
MPDFIPLLSATAGGMLPAFAWLWFWLREDSKHPEPRRLIALAFLAGMITVGFTIVLEQYVATFVTAETLKFSAWSVIEECMKFMAAFIVVLWRRANDEPIDAVIYMVTVALGFAAAENTLFLLSPISGGSFPQEVATGSLRFIGATLLHVLSSSTIGIGLALAFYKRGLAKIPIILAGVILACLLHATFNFLILNTPQEELLRTFGFVWVGVIGLLAILEFIKRIHPRRI